VDQNWPEDPLFLEPYHTHLDSMAAKYPGLAATDLPGEMAVFSILRTGSLILNTVSHNLARFGISESAFNILTLLATRPEGLTQTELSRYLIVSRANITGLVDRLAGKNLVERQNDPRDRRVSLVNITARGQSLLERILPQHYRFMNRLLASLQTQDKEQLIRILAQVRRLLHDLPANDSAPV